MDKDRRDGGAKIQFRFFYFSFNTLSLTEANTKLPLKLGIRKDKTLADKLIIITKSMR